LDDLAGYRLSYGQAPDALNRVVPITDIGHTQQMIENSSGALLRGDNGRPCPSED